MAKKLHKTKGWYKAVSRVVMDEKILAMVIIKTGMLY